MGKNQAGWGWYWLMVPFQGCIPSHLQSILWGSCAYGDVGVLQIMSDALAGLLGPVYHVSGSSSSFASWWACRLHKQILGQQHKSVKVSTVTSCVAKLWQWVVLDCSAAEATQALRQDSLMLLALRKPTQQNLHHIDIQRRFTTNLGAIGRTGPLGVHSQEIFRYLPRHYEVGWGHSWFPEDSTVFGLKKIHGGTFLSISMGSHNTHSLRKSVLNCLRFRERVWPVLHNAVYFDAFPKTYISKSGFPENKQ